MALPRRPRSQGEAKNRELCGPARQKYFHVSDKRDKGSSVRENVWVHLKLHITRGSIPFVLGKFCVTLYCIFLMSFLAVAANNEHSYSFDI